MHIKFRALPLSLSVGALVAQDKNPKSADRGANHAERERRHALVMLPNYNVFDSLAFRVVGRAVTLIGQAGRCSGK